MSTELENKPKTITSREIKTNDSDSEKNPVIKEIRKIRNYNHKKYAKYYKIKQSVNQS